MSAVQLVAACVALAVVVAAAFGRAPYPAVLVRARVGRLQRQVLGGASDAVGRPDDRSAIEGITGLVPGISVLLERAGRGRSIAGGERASRGALARRLLPPSAGARRREQAAYVALLDGLGRSLRSGAGIHQALREVVASPGAPPAGVERFVEAVDRGTPLHEAVESWRTGQGAPEAALVGAVLGLGLSSGGNLARAVDRAAATVRERVAIEREARALATQATTSAAVVAVAPLVFAALASIGDPQVGAFLLTDPLGWACIVLGLGLETAGGLWMLRSIRRAV